MRVPLLVFFVLGLLTASCGSDESPDTSALTPLNEGDCFNSLVELEADSFEMPNLLLDEDQSVEVEVVSCEGPHDGVVTAISTSPEDVKDPIFCGQAAEDSLSEEAREGGLAFGSSASTFSREAEDDEVSSTQVVVCAFIFEGP